MIRRTHLIAISWVGALAGLTLTLTANTPAQATMADSSVSVSITESGFDPAVITITVGTTVVWTNYTTETVHMVSGEPCRIYLPMVLSNAGGTSAAADSPPMATAVITRQQDDWGDEDIASGESYTHTFTMAGNYPYFSVGHPDRTGLVVASYDWTRLSTGITETLEAVYFVDTQNGWVAGHVGAIFHTTDGGQSWQRQDSGTTDNLRDMFFLDLNRGWIVGGEGLILRTTDGGNTWETQVSPRDTFLGSIHFTDEDHGWIAGGHYTVSGWPPTFRAYGYVLRSTDGGDSWSLADYISYRYAIDLHFVDATHGWLATNYIDNSTYNTIPKVYVTSDGGSTWTNQSIPVSIGGLNAVTFVDANTGWVVGDIGIILHTTNAGTLWSQQESGVTSSLEAVQFVSPTTGWIVGSILHTEDGGENWASQSADPVCTGLRDLHFLDIDHGWAVGANGMVCKYH